MTLRYRLSALASNGGDQVTVPSVGVTCIVGGNNAGKSQALRDIVQIISDRSARPVAVTAIAAALTGDLSQSEEWLETTAVRQPAPPGYPPSYTPTHGGNQLTLEQFNTWIRGASDGLLSHAATFFYWHATAGALVGYATGGMGTPGMGPAASPLGALFRDGDLEERLSVLSREVFGQPLTLDRVNGDVRLRVGDPGLPAPPLNRPTLQYADAVRRLASLEHQGDGMRAFMGLALYVVAGGAQVLLVDEPEAFLHPAQARALGRWLATEAQAQDRQIILATHDRDLVLGLLDAEAPVKMIRISRNSDRTSLHELSEAELSDIWADPVLRYSNVLQGLFHEQVVVCEADADCRFYGAVLDALATESGSRSLADATLFVPSGGKQRAPVLAGALSRLGVSAYVIADFDLLNDRDQLKAALVSVNGVWDQDLDRLYLAVAGWANQTSAWPSLKTQGLSGLKAGTVYSAGKDLLDRLASMRLLLVPVGEMESFDKSVDGHGSPWVSAMLEKGGHKSSAEARQLVGPLAARSAAT
ncbi:ATP-dependent nuclease [Blastococcus capsensis]|uniref:ATP-dependent nuclease n=1 Tax=Blastococcus capsensis TaxID=1564163 RepID=UPI002541D50C|nr:AAA family ATPase [Blastococcus capsensis]MDK3255718.1 AAA family ATPase [Blastococcus capsensis]